MFYLFALYKVRCKLWTRDASMDKVLAMKTLALNYPGEKPSTVVEHTPCQGREAE